MTTRRDGPPGPRTNRPGFGRAPFRRGPPQNQRGAASVAAASGDHVVLYGWHPVAQALANEGRKLHRLLATENAMIRLTEEIGTLRIDPELVRPSAINALLGPDAVHQGLYLEADPLPGPDLDELGDDVLLLALDQITDLQVVDFVMEKVMARPTGIEPVFSP